VVVPVNDPALWLRESIPRQLSLVESDDLQFETLSGDRFGFLPAGPAVEAGDLVN
jgi:hypothetical protein